MDHFRIIVTSAKLEPEPEPQPPFSSYSEEDQQMLFDLLKKHARTRALHCKNLIEWYKTFFAKWESATANERQQMKGSYPDFVTEPDMQKFMKAFDKSGMSGVQDGCFNFVIEKLQEETTMQEPFPYFPPDFVEVSLPIYREAFLEEYRRLTENA